MLKMTNRRLPITTISPHGNQPSDRWKTTRAYNRELVTSKVGAAEQGAGGVPAKWAVKGAAQITMPRCRAVFSEAAWVDPFFEAFSGQALKTGWLSAPQKWSCCRAERFFLGRTQRSALRSLFGDLGQLLSFSDLKLHFQIKERKGH